VFGTLSEYKDPELGREVSVRGWPCEVDKGNTTNLTRTTFETEHHESDHENIRHVFIINLFMFIYLLIK